MFYGGIKNSILVQNEIISTANKLNKLTVKYLFPDCLVNLK